MATITAQPELTGQRMRLDTAVTSGLAAEAVIALAGVSVTRGGATLLDRVDWVVEEDERWVVLGPNGAGKTTLLQIAAATMHPSAGQAWVLGQRLGAVDVFDLRPRIGLTSAALAGRVPPRERAVDVVVSAGYSVVGRWREAYGRFDLRRAHQLLRQFGVSEHADREYATLSEGERKRVQLARAMMPDPELLLLDEPASGLDLGGREDLVRRLRSLAEDPDAPAMVLVTHHVEEIPPGISHALLLRGGRVVASGLAADVLTSQNLSVAFGLPLVLDRVGGRYFAYAGAH